MDRIDLNQVNHSEDIGDVSKEERDFSKYIAMLKCFGTMFNHAAFLYSYEKRKIIHFEGRHSFLNYDCEKDSKEYAFYERRVHKEDLSLLAQTTKAAFDFLQDLPYDRKCYACISSNFRMKGKNRYKLVNHKLAPLELTGSGQLRIALCTLSLSVENSLENVYIRMYDTSQVYEYIPSHDRFMETKNQRLSSQGFMILELSAMGKTEDEIAGILKIKKSTVKYHKREIFQSFGVNNISAAIQWYNNHKCY